MMIDKYKAILKIYKLLNYRIGNKLDGFVQSFTPEIDKCFSSKRDVFDSILDDGSSWMYVCEEDSKMVTYMQDVHEVSVGDKEVTFNFDDEGVFEIEPNKLLCIANFSEVNMAVRSYDSDKKIYEIEHEKLLLGNKGNSVYEAYLLETNALYEDKVVAKALISYAQDPEKIEILSK